MPYTSGTVTNWCNKAFTGDSLATGDGTTLIFSGTLTNYPIFPESLEISYTIGGTPYTATTSAGGVITGTSLAGTLTSEKDYSLTFSTAPDNTTNIVAAYTGKGVLQKVKDFVVSPSITNVIGTGDGTTTVFSTTLTGTSSNISKGQVHVRFKIGIDEYFVWDDGLGTFDHHSLISASSIDYTTKAISITFTDAITNLYDIVCTFTDGAEGQDWLILSEYNTQNNAVSDAFPGELLKTMLFRNSGENYQDNVTVGVRETKYATALYFSWDCLCYYDADFNELFRDKIFNSAYNTTYKAYTNNPQLPTAELNLNYNIFSSKNRIIVVVRSAATVDSSIYLGLGLRYTDTISYQNPLLCAASSSGNKSYNSLSSDFDSIITTKYYNSNYVDRSNNRNGAYLSGNYSYTSHSEKGVGISTTAIGDCTDSSVLLTPVDFFAGNVSVEKEVLLFRLENVYGCFSPAVSSGDSIIVGSDSYKVFQSAYKTAPYDYFCVKEE